MKFLIRDDDTCGFTKVEELEKCYENIWPEIPVCLSVTPFRIPGAIQPFRNDTFGVPHNYLGSIKPIPLSENSELVSFLKEGLRNGWLDIALHGYHHWITNYKEKDNDKSFAPWREYLYGSDLIGKTHEGKAYLERILNTEINTFVPPGNDISKNGIKAVYKNKLNLVNSPSLWRFNKRPFNLKAYQIAFKKYKWEFLYKSQRFPFVIDLTTHKEISYYLLYPSTDLSEIKKELDFCYAVDGVFILSTHYHAFHKRINSGQTIKYALHSILEYASKKKSVGFIKYKDLW